MVVVGLSPDLRCGPQPDACPAYVSVSHHLGRSWDAMVLDAPFSPFSAAFPGASLTLPGAAGGA